MAKVGGIIGVIAGILGLLAGLVTLGLGDATSQIIPDSKDARNAINIGWLGMALSTLNIFFGAIAISSHKKTAGSILSISAVYGLYFGNILTAFPMLLALIGGILAVVGVAYAPDKKLSVATSQVNANVQEHQASSDAQAITENNAPPPVTVALQNTEIIPNTEPASGWGGGKIFLVVGSISLIASLIVLVVLPNLAPVPNKVHKTSYQQAEQEDHLRSPGAKLIELGQFTANLIREDKDHYLQIAISLKVTNPNMEDKIKETKPEILSRVNTLLQSKRLSDLTALNGKELLAQQIKAQVEYALGLRKTPAIATEQGAAPIETGTSKSSISEVLFTTFTH